MSETLILSQALLWVVVVVLIISNILLLRQVGVLYERIAPAGALATNALLGKGTLVAPRIENDISDRKTKIGGEHSNGRSQLLFFASPDCPVCKSILPALRSLAAKQKETVELILASAGEERSEHHDFIVREGLADYPYILSDQLGMEMGVSKLPYAVLINPDGKVASFGLINSREHLESLFEAQKRQVVSLQEYMRNGDAA